MTKLELWASVDIMKGKVVRLVRGNPNNMIVYDDDPVSAALRWESAGFDGIHIVDLDAALGIGENVEQIKKVSRAVSIPVHVGGGIRSLERLRSLMDADIDRFVIGTVAFSNPEVFDEMLRILGSDRVIVALDHRGGRVVVKGWLEELGLGVEEAATELMRRDVRMFLMTDAERDGTLSGISADAIARVTSIKGAMVYAAGGISSIDDVIKLKGLGVRGLVLGRAIYEREIDVSKAMEVARS